MPDIIEDPLAALKTRLRAEAIARRLVRADATAGNAAALQLLTRIPLAQADSVAAYVAMRGEIDPAPVLDILHDRGIATGLPVVEARDHPLTFRAWVPGDPLVPGPYRTFTAPASHAPLVPTVLIVPLLVFDRRGGRIGYGGGYYDRTLAALRAQGPIYAIGLAYGFQETDTVPVMETDQLLDAIATERDVIIVRERAR